MPTPVHVTFRHMQPRPELEDYARDRASRLERFYGRIVGSRVLLDPNNGALRVLVEITVPGERLVASYELDPADPAAAVDRPPVPEHRWLHALHEAFEAAERIVQEHADRRRAGRTARRYERIGASTS